MNILITGGLGFIGTHLSKKLFEDGHRITIIDNLNPQIHKNNPHHLYYHNLIKCNLQSIFPFEIENNYDIIYHLASETGTGQSMYEIKRYCDSNINGTVNLLELIKNFNIKPQKIILTSSRAVYGEGKYFCPKHGYLYPNIRLNENLKNKKFNMNCPICNQIIQNLPSDETDILNPISIYATTKLTQENLIKNFCYYNDISYTILRLQNVYGEGQSLCNPYTGILSIFSNQILNNQIINVFEDGLESRDFIYVSDVVNILYECILNSDINNEIVNIGNGIDIKIIDVVQKLIKIYNKGNFEITGDYRLGDIRSNYANLTKFWSLFNYRNKIDIDQGLNMLSNWVLKGV